MVQVNITIELSNAVGRYLSSAARQRELGDMTDFSTYLSMQVQSGRKRSGLPANY